MKKIIISLIIFFLFSLATLRVFAQVSPEPSPTDTRIQQQVEERIEKVLKAAEERKKRALIGSIKTISNSTLTIETKDGDFQAKMATDAAIINLKREEIKLEDLEIGNKIICIGYLDNQNILEAKRIVVVTQFQTPATEVAFGVVTDISQEEKVLTIKNPKKQTIYMVEVGTNTKITKKVEGKIQTVKFGDIKENDRLVAIGKPGENEEKIIVAKIIHVIPGKAVGQQSPTPSSKASPSPIVSPVATPEGE